MWPFGKSRRGNEDAPVTPEHGPQMEAILGCAPADLVEFYRAAQRPRFPESRVNCLSFEEAAAYTRDMLGIPLCRRLGLWVLDDAGDSNPFCYISRGPCAGAVIHFSHDPEPHLHYASLRRFLRCMIAIGAAGGDIDDTSSDADLSMPCGDEVVRLCGDGSEDAVSLLCIYLPVCSDLGAEAKELLAAHGDFLVREAFALRLKAQPRPEDRGYAERLAADAHPQVSGPAAAAVREIGGL